MNKPDMQEALLDALHEHLDIELARVVQEARGRFPELDAATFSGSTVGLMMKSAIAIAARDGCPRAVIEASALASITDAYGPQLGNRKARRAAAARGRS